jgi:predicted AlkP superfamily phosphohydrolase/phosphomutase
MKSLWKAIFLVLFLPMLVLVLTQCTPVPAKKVFILAVDGLDPKLLEKFMAAGHLPNFQKLVSQGDFKPLQTTMPPLSPVAWSTFITGMDPGGHGIFDFIHRDPENMIPYLSLAQAGDPARNLSFGSWVIPLESGSLELLRKGPAFWQILEEHGVPTTIFRMPANFPPVTSKGKSLSGMGTPDILGTPGTFSFYTDQPPANAQDITGGRVFEVEVINNTVQGQLVGPPNNFRRIPQDSSSRRPASTEYLNPDLELDFTVYLDPDESVAKLVVQDDEFVLKEGEWSDWIQVDFEAVPYLVSISAIGRFYLQQVRPHFRLYVTPLQIDPIQPAMPISTPEGWSHELAEELGYFYTQELPEDTKAFDEGIFDGREFWQQAQFVFGEQRRALDYSLRNFKEGLSYFYFSSVDQGSHMLWRYMDEQHPNFIHDEKLALGIQTLYQQIDEALGEVLQAVDESTTVIVMSDHGFAPFKRGVNLNSWLLERGYVKLKDPTKRGDPLFLNVDWSGTRAYAFGLNGLYINLRGRERNGIVAPGTEYQQLLDELEADLLAMSDPESDENPVTLVVQTQRDFQGRNLDRAPDIVVGYNWGYRSSWESPLGEFTWEIFADNDRPWSGDHGMDYRLVPGVLVSNRKITLEDPALYDLTVAVLDEYGIPKHPEMIGQDCLSP